MDTELKFGVLIVIFILGLSIIIGTAALISESMAMPRCSEDAIIIGGGDFVDGRWTYYSCGPARDDYL